MLVRKMRRFAVSYLTISVAIILLANLVLVIFYARQFSLNAQALADCLNATCRVEWSLKDFIVVNSVLVGLLLVIWFAITKFRFHHQAS
ncbi:MAG: hypothetical protein UX60_C0033G0007 [Berkelbacteria bacterium GW2011_GWA2_46_7]|uniref:Uncharacterized protein n=1 Tax=Berkelbacteria bacterium GW2011_GWA2_46_7 TaxID=1618335 RepID=A0A0G1QDV4_9BACT|nr:MAG: hypothetical protein UX60_C0033G0007 [Berkelbacteria bacterium GW2011_GWA2_46_7]